MAKQHTVQNRYVLLKNPTGAEESDALYREEFLENTIYIDNPGGVPVSLYSSATGDGTVTGNPDTWHEELTEATSSRHHRIRGKMGWFKAVAADAGDVTVTILSGGREAR